EPCLHAVHDIPFDDSEARGRDNEIIVVMKRQVERLVPRVTPQVLLFLSGFGIPNTDHPGALLPPLSKSGGRQPAAIGAENDLYDGAFLRISNARIEFGS